MSNKKNNASSLAAVIHQHAQDYPEKDAIVYLDETPEQAIRLSYADLDRQARRLAAFFQQEGMHDKLAILIYPLGIDFVITYLACLYAGVIPVNLGLPEKTYLQEVLRDTQAEIILTNDADYPHMVNRDDGNAYRVIVTSQIKGQQREINLKTNHDPQHTALIQYSSGTTGQPKGVVITHENLLHSLAVNSNAWHIQPADTALTRTSQQYIFGLITGILLPLYNANTNYLMPPERAMNQPFTWLQALSDFKINYSGAPNFGYQRCIDAITPAETILLDLSHWRLAICGGEWIQSETVQQFTNKFKHSGFKAASFCPSYGMSELTGYISAAPVGSVPRQVDLSAKKIMSSPCIGVYPDTGQLNLMSCGIMATTMQIKIIDIETQEELSDGDIGEICLAGPTLASGYISSGYEPEQLYKDKETQQFYFRTGDLGFLDSNELCIVGRIREIININGKKYLPGKMEEYSKSSHDLINHNQVIAVSFNKHGKEQILILIEIDENVSSLMYQTLCKAVHVNMIKHISLVVDNIVLVRRNSLPRTSGGKLQRIRARELFINSKLDLLYEYNYDNTHLTNQSTFQVNNLALLPDEERLKQIKDDIYRIIENILHVDISTNTNARLFDLGMTSLLAVDFKEQIQKKYNNEVTIPASFVFEYPSVAAMAKYINERMIHEWRGAVNE